jgi:hypothetical protein
MAQVIKIKRSTTTATPSTLAAGELAYSDNSDKLFIGAPADSAVIAIGGKLYVDMLDHTAGTLTADSAIVVDSNSKIDQLKTANLTLGANALTSGSGDIDLVVAAGAALDIDAGTINLDTQATEFSLIDDSATALTISEGANNYLTFDTRNAQEKIVFNKQIHVGNIAANGYSLPLTDGTSGQALITDGAGGVTFTTISTELDIAGDTGTDTISLITDTFTFTGGEGIDTAVTNNTLTITAETATSSNLGVASFDATDFTVTAGAVAANAITLGTSSLNLGETTLTLAGLQQLDVDNVQIDGNTISTTDANGNLILSPNGTGVVNVPSGYKDRTQFGTNSLVTKEYVDALKQSLDIKDSVKVATTADLGATYNNGAGTLTNAGANAALSIDTISLSSGDRVLVKDQSSQAENGIYTVTTVGDGSTPWVLTRAEDADESAELTGGVFTFVEDGSDNADNGYVFTHNGAPTLGTTALPVSQFSGAGQIIAGDALSKTGNTLNVNDDNITLEISSDALRIKGISATAAGDLLIGAAANGGYTALAKPSTSATAYTYLLSMDSSGNAAWADTLDGGTF